MGSEPLAPPESRQLLTAAEVAALFRVDTRTVTRWARAGKLPHLRTPGGHRRFDAEMIHRMLAAGFNRHRVAALAPRRPDGRFSR